MKIEIDGNDAPKPEIKIEPAPQVIKNDNGLFENIFSTLKGVILSPGSFYSKNADDLVSGKTVASALAFALLIDWIASVFGFFWRTVAGVVLEKHLSDIFRITSDVLHAPTPYDSDKAAVGFEMLKSKVTEFFFGAGSVILAPFMTLIQIGLVTFFVHAAVKFFIIENPERKQSFPTTMKIICYGMAPNILAVVPGIGMLAAWLLSFAATVIGLREVYKTTTTRAVIAVMFPQIVAVTLLLIFVFFAIFGVIFLMQLAS